MYVKTTKLYKNIFVHGSKTGKTKPIKTANDRPRTHCENHINIGGKYQRVISLLPPSKCTTTKTTGRPQPRRQRPADHPSTTGKPNSGFQLP